MKIIPLYLLNIVLTSWLMFVFVACNAKNKTTKTQVNTTSHCLEIKFNDFKKTACKIGAGIKQYDFQNKTVYAFLPGNCGADMTTEIIDENCKTLGFLGGIMGNTQINGEKFPINESKKILWESN